MFLIKKINLLINKMAFKVYLYLDRFVNAQWYSFPYGDTPHATIEEYEELATLAKSKTPKVVTNYENKIGFFINTEWLDDLALHTQIVVKKSDLSYIHGRIIYTTLMEYLQKVKEPRINIIETGTARGFSALCMAKALEDSHAQGLITTFDIIPHHKKMIWNCIDDHVGAKSRSELLSPWQKLIDKYIVFHQGYTKVELHKVQLDRVHFAFLDGAHGYDDVISEFNSIKHKQKQGDIIIYDDYNKVKFPGLVKAVDEICAQNSYKRIDIMPDSDRGYIIAIKE